MITLERLVAEFSARLADGAGALFVGSGLSVPSGLPDWAGLLKRPAQDIGLKLVAGDNLPQVAQYVVNSYGGNRGVLVSKLRGTIAKADGLNQYHRALSVMNVTSIWTTNYDTLLEQTFPDFFVRSNDAHISHPGSGGGGEVVKMHGCIVQSAPDDIVISTEDFEDYFIRRPATARRLEMDLIRRSFLFIGYGYGDPNIANIMVEARRLAKKALGHHYMIQKAEKDRDKALRQELFVKDLARIGIACCLVDSYEALEEALFDIALQSRGKTIFATGGHRARSELAKRVGRSLASVPELTMVDGQSTGVSRQLISTYSLACLQQKEDIRKRLLIFPNPYAIQPKFENDLSLLPELKIWRSPLLRATQIMLVFDGGQGTRAELEVARGYRCTIVPVPEKKGGLPSELIKEKAVYEPLHRLVPDYVRAAKTGSVSADQVKECVTKLLQR